ncbi:hypothetical protein Tco_1285477 [Tanacetum coccineum]
MLIIRRTEYKVEDVITTPHEYLKLLTVYGTSTAQQQNLSQSLQCQLPGGSTYMKGLVDCFFYKIPMCTLNVNVKESASAKSPFQNLLEIADVGLGKLIQKLRQKESIESF